MYRRWYAVKTQIGPLAAPGLVFTSESDGPYHYHFVYVVAQYIENNIEAKSLKVHH